ncbi:MAG: SMP-30/gluconolactonase/LRE family protein [Novosphingobium sp.]
MADTGATALADERVDFVPLASGFAFVEAPRVDDDGTIWFSDLTGTGYFRQRPGQPAEAMLPGRQWIGGAVLTVDGNVICSGRGGLVRIDATSGEVTPVLTEFPGVDDLSINDIEADRHGGLYGGTIDFVAIMERNETPRPGTFFYLAPDGALRILRDDVFASNGLGFSPDGKFMYHSETSRGVWRYPLAADGTPGTPELLVGMEDSDGLVVDSKGAFWVVGWSSGDLRRYLPDGTLDRLIHLPFPHLVSVAFGGPDLHDLYISTGADAERPGIGGVVKIRVDVPGQRDFRTRIGMSDQGSVTRVA